MKIFYETDWHIHTEASYDADLKVSDLIERAKQNGIRQFGISDHVNYPVYGQAFGALKICFQPIRQKDFISV